jgi:large subunit ribosomal protein L21
MYAIVEIAGQQFKVEKDKKIFVHRLDKNEGDKLEFEKVLLVDDEGKIKLGTPVLEGAKIAAKVLEHVRGEKVKIFKKKRRKGYQKLSGHRQDFTRIEIESITF